MSTPPLAALGRAAPSSAAGTGSPKAASTAARLPAPQSVRPKRTSGTASSTVAPGPGVREGGAVATQPSDAAARPHAARRATQGSCELTLERGDDEDAEEDGEDDPDVVRRLQAGSLQLIDLTRQLGELLGR